MIKLFKMAPVLLALAGCTVEQYPQYHNDISIERHEVVQEFNLATQTVEFNRYVARHYNAIEQYGVAIEWSTELSRKAADKLANTLKARGVTVITKKATDQLTSGDIRLSVVETTAHSPLCRRVTSEHFFNENEGCYTESTRAATLVYPEAVYASPENGAR